MPKAVIFDLDDTLYDEIKFVYSGFKVVAQHLSTGYGLDNGQLYLRMQQLLCEKGRGRIFDELLKENGIDSSLVSTLVKVYRSHRPELELYPDAREILRELKGSTPGLSERISDSKEIAPDLKEITPGFKEEVMTGLITDGAAPVQWNKIKALGLEGIMDLIIVTDDYGTECWKPSTFPYQMVMDKLGVSPESCIYIGDNPEKDFVTARELGWHTVRIRRPGGMCFEMKKAPVYEADYDITDLLQITPILLKLWNLNIYKA